MEGLTSGCAYRAYLNGGNANEETSAAGHIHGSNFDVA